MYALLLVVFAFAGAMNALGTRLAGRGGEERR
jgi:hypothetical protein